MKIQTSMMPLSQNISLDAVSSNAGSYSEANLTSVCREAALEAMRRDPEFPLVTDEDFMLAPSIVKPALLQDVESWFSGMQKRLKGSPANSGFIGLTECD